MPDVNSRRIPSGSTSREAAASILPFLTAWQMVVHKAQVAPGDTVLVQGAGSGIGVAAIQIAKLHGARVIATAGTDDKLARAKAARRRRGHQLHDARTSSPSAAR